MIIHIISRLGKELIQNVVDITLSQDMFSNPDLSKKTIPWTIQFLSFVHKANFEIAA